MQRGAAVRRKRTRRRHQREQLGTCRLPDVEFGSNSRKAEHGPLIEPA